jgi:hypothetical protein
MNIRRTILAVTIAVLASGAAWGADGRNFRARLTGAEEVPPVTDTNTRGSSSFRFNRDLTRLNFTLQLRSGEDLKEVHLHCAPRGVNGPVIASLVGLAGPASTALLPLIPGGFSGSLNVAGTLTDASIVRYSSAASAAVQLQGCRSTIGRDIVNLADLAEAMRNGEIYVNAHSAQHPAGAARGQVTRKGGGTGTGTATTSGGGSAPTGTNTGSGPPASGEY